MLAIPHQRPPFEIGAHWAYRANDRAPAQPVEILQVSSPRFRHKKARIRYLDGVDAGMTELVTHLRLLTVWDEAAAWLEDERRYRAVCAASEVASDDPELRAASHL